MFAGGVGEGGGGRGVGGGQSFGTRIQVDVIETPASASGADAVGDGLDARGDGIGQFRAVGEVFDCSV